MKKMPSLTDNTLEICRTVQNDPIYTRYEKVLERSRVQLKTKIEQADKARQELEHKELKDMEDYN